MGFDVVEWLKSLWGEQIRPRLAVLFGEAFGELKDSELFELAVERGRIAVRSLLQAEVGVTNVTKARIVEDQIRAELERLGQRARTHVIEQARIFAYRSVIKEDPTQQPDFSPIEAVQEQGS